MNNKTILDCIVEAARLLNKEEELQQSIDHMNSKTHICATSQDLGLLTELLYCCKRAIGELEERLPKAEGFRPKTKEMVGLSSFKSCLYRTIPWTKQDTIVQLIGLITVIDYCLCEGEVEAFENGDVLFGDYTVLNKQYEKYKDLKEACKDCKLIEGEGK